MLREGGENAGRVAVFLRKARMDEFYVENSRTDVCETVRGMVV